MVATIFIFHAHFEGNPNVYQGMGRVSPSLNAAFGGDKLELFYLKRNVVSLAIGGAKTFLFDLLHQRGAIEFE